MARGSWRLGVVCILLVALIWNASSVLVQAIFTDANFARPYFLTWVANSLFLLALPLRSLCRRFAPPAIASHAAREAGEPDSDEAAAHLASDAPRRSPPRRLSSTARAALFVCPIWFTANFTYNLSMSMTSITASTVISSSSSAFTLLLSVLFLSEPLNVLKVAGVLFCWLGNALTLLSDGGDSPATNSSSPPVSPPSRGPLDVYSGPGHMAVGDAICLLSALLYATYTVAISRAEREMEDLALFFGYLGGFTFCIFGPLVPVLHLSGAEDLNSITWPIVGLLLCKGVFDNVLSEYLWAQSVLLTSPSVATVGTSITVPLALISDAVLPSAWLVAPSSPSLPSVGAAVCVLVGFVTINLASTYDNASSASRLCRMLHEPLIKQRIRRGTTLAAQDSCAACGPLQRVTDVDS
ncbi:hypothetical protein AB1Y20_003899 [Prymnesium parvum]|uniref:EamA domain-containing protein n=1 Tax=Prymnesium parvum TaxID=97485 RepID=A0AB34J692_PRYPA